MKSAYEENKNIPKEKLNTGCLRLQHAELKISLT
jgi:hypothetical protein